VSRLALPLLQALASSSVPTDQRLVGQFIKDVAMVTDFLGQLWQQSSATLLDGLRQLFAIISATEGPEPSVCLGSLGSLIK
jgi:hypothetical protein